MRAPLNDKQSFGDTKREMMDSSRLSQHLNGMKKVRPVGSRIGICGFQMKRVNEGSVAGTWSGAQRHKGRDSCGGAAARGECYKHLGTDNPGNRSSLVSKEPLVAVYGRLLGRGGVRCLAAPTKIMGCSP